MALRVSTTGSNVALDDLGIEIGHPTTARDLSLEFSSQELKDSEDLTLAIQNGDLTVDDGQFLIDGTDYNPSEVVNQELGLKTDRRFVSHDELLASYKNTPIVPSVFPIALNSTASVTKNVYAPAAKWGTWEIDKDDIIEITGSTGADGVYTVDTVSDSQNFTVVEAIADSTGGNLSVYHPAASKRIGIDPANLSWTTATDLQQVMDDLDGALGSQDEKVKVSANDADAGYLFEQLEAGTNVIITEENDGANEKVKISVTPNAGQFDVNRMVLDCDGSMIYIGKGDIVICDNPLPGPVTNTNCE